MKRNQQGLPERTEYPARVHIHQHVPKTLEGKRAKLPQLVDRLIELALETKSPTATALNTGEPHERKIPYPRRTGSVTPRTTERKKCAKLPPGNQNDGQGHFAYPHPAFLRAEHKNERRYNIALGSPEFHLNKPKINLPKFSMPRMPHFRANWRMGALILAFVLITALVLAFQLPYFYVPSANVFGNTRIFAEEINGIIGVSGQNIFTLKPDELGAACA